MEAKDYFNDLVTINPTLIAFITVFVFGSLLSLLALYSIIWFEHFGSDCQSNGFWSLLDFHSIEFTSSVDRFYEVSV
jgi:hypothetical protein